MYTPLLARLIDSCADVVGSEEDHAGMEAEWLEVFRSFGGDSAASFEASQVVPRRATRSPLRRLHPHAAPKRNRIRYRPCAARPVWRV